MKTATKFFTLIGLMLFIGLSAEVNAQGRGHGHEKGRRGNDRHDHRDRHDKHHSKHYDHHDHHDRHDHHYDHHHHDRRVVHHVYHHQHSRHCGHRVVVHHYERPRYVYYRDYDVYYDCHRQVYISYSGRNWSISASLPIVMHHVDVHHAVRVGVDYYEDDFATYLDRGRPMYGSVQVGW